MTSSCVCREINPWAYKIILIEKLKKLDTQGIEYFIVSDYFKNALGLRRPFFSRNAPVLTISQRIVEDILIEDSKGEKSYTQVVNDIKNLSFTNLGEISALIDSLPNYDIM
jgi:hypothetical protein